MDGELVRIRPSDNGRFRIIHFWASWCSVCVSELGSIVDFTKKVDHLIDPVFVAVRDQVKPVRMLTEHFAFDTFLDPFGKQMLKYGILAVPATILVDSNLDLVNFPDPVDFSLTKVIKGAREWSSEKYVEYFLNYLKREVLINTSKKRYYNILR